MVDTRRAQTADLLEQTINHQDVVAVEGLEDLFRWASDLVAEGNEFKGRKFREQKIRRNVLDIIQRNKEFEAQEKYSEEIHSLQKRVIALLQIMGEKIEENSALKQTILCQQIVCLRVPELEAEVKQLQSLTWYRDEAEAERKHLMNALAKLKKERDYLEEILTVNESENERLSRMLGQLRTELDVLRNRRWWHKFVAPIRDLLRDQIVRTEAS